MLPAQNKRPYLAGSFFHVGSELAQGCQIFLGATYQNGQKYTKLTPKDHKIYQIAILISNSKYSMKYTNISNSRDLQNISNWDFFVCKAWTGKMATKRLGSIT
jgi:hypothetical protein